MRPVARVLVTRAAPAIVGSMAVLVVVDWGVGAVWDRATGTTTASVPALELAVADLPRAEDDRSSSAAMAGQPWAERYFQEFAALPVDYAPFIGPREAPVRGRYINSADGIRASYLPVGADDDDALTIWFFGGSTLWGEGQRDEYTIPSQVARLAEREGVPLRVVNYGIRGYTAFQEYLVFEQELARRPPPDLAVFYHGINETYSLLESPDNLGEQPSIFQLEVYADAFRRAPPLPGPPPRPEPSVLEAYLRTGAVTRAVRAGVEALTPPAGADEPVFQSTPEEIERATLESEQIYRRSVSLIDHESRSHGVPTMIFWQPAGTDEVSSQYYDSSARFAGVGGGIDITDALADPPGPIYIDAVHTNELGARLSAEAMWEYLAPVVAGMVDR